MRDGLKIMDCDRHVLEPATMWDDYLEAPFKHYGITAESWFGFGTLMGGKRMGSGRVGGGIQELNPRGMLNNPAWRGKFKYAISRKFDNVSYLHDMDVEGVDVAFLFTSIGLYATFNDGLDPELAAAMCRAYNNWLYDYCSMDPNRMKGVCLLPLQDIDLAQQELRRAATELGMRGIFWRPNPLEGRKVSDPYYDPLFALCQETGVTVCFHEGQQESLPYFARGRVENAFARHATCHPMEQMGALAAMTSDGVLDRFPRLHVAFLESGCGWLPYWLDRLDKQADNYYLGADYGGKEKPSEYFHRGQCFISGEAGEETIPMLERLVGEDCLMWASDYPHPDVVEYFPDTVGSLVTNDQVSLDFRRKILWDNPTRFYNLEV